MRVFIEIFIGKRACVLYFQYFEKGSENVICVFSIHFNSVLKIPVPAFDVDFKIAPKVKTGSNASQ